MIQATYLIIGGGIAGTTAAETVRKHDPSGSITIVSDEPHRLYSRIMLSKQDFFLEKIPLERIWLKKESWYQDHQIDFLGGKTAMALDHANKVVVLDDGTQIQYQKLLLAMGGKTRPWPVLGSDKQGIHPLQSLDDAQALIQKIKTAKRAVIVGGGFIGFEMADLLRRANIEVALLTRRGRYWESVFDEASSNVIEIAMEKAGVKMIHGVEVTEVLGMDSVSGVRLSNGESIHCDTIVLGIGMEHPIGWIAEAGVPTANGILVNDHLQTDVDAIWAAGDIAEFDDEIMGERMHFCNWVNAQQQGRYAGLAMVDKAIEPFHLVSSYTSSGFGLHLAFIGDARLASDRHIVVRQGEEDQSMMQFILKQNRLIGATLINRVGDIGMMTKLIESRMDLSSYIQSLSDPLFSFTSFII